MRRALSILLLSAFWLTEAFARVAMDTCQWDVTMGDTDVSTYDRMDRLVHADMGGHVSMGMTYGANGNITHKDGVGDYNYGNY